MANIITEVYASIDGENFTKLDLNESESIPMSYTTKDLQDLSKIFSPYSLNFAFPATPRNRAALGFFGDTDVVKINKESKFITKVYTNGGLNLTGFLQLEDLKYRDNKPTSFIGSFATSMTNLRDRLGEDLIGDLPSGNVFINWTPPEVYKLLQYSNNTQIDGVRVNYFVPLISSNRVLSFDANTESALKDNVAYETGIDPDSNSTIKSNELRPCINFSSIIDLIKFKYNLEVIAPLDKLKEYTEAVVWCNSESMFNPTDAKLTVKNIFGNLYSYDTKNESGIPDPKKYTVSVNKTDGVFKVVRRDPPISTDNNYTKYFTAVVDFQNVIITGDASSPTVNLKIVRKDTDEILASKQFDINESEFNCEIQIADDLFIDNEIEYYITAQFNQPTTWLNCYYKIWFRYYDGKTGIFNRKEYATYAYDIDINDNAADVSGTKIDLFKSLPEMKVVDFLTSYFKLFNLSVFDTSPNNEKLYWLTPDDIKTEGLAYSKAVLDYTPYVNDQDLTKSRSGKYNYYNFKHATSKYKSNVDYLSAAGLEYGQAVYPEIKPDNPIDFTVETEFTLMVPVVLNGSDDIITYYGFTNDAPEILETGESRYSPNYGELTIFYNNGSKALTNLLGFQTISSYGNVNAPIQQYMQVLPVNTENKSIAFSVIRYNNETFSESLYKRYYEKQTERLLDPNVMTQYFELTLPPQEIYLNEATTIQGGGSTPRGFRLQNDIIIKEDLFSILDAELDVTTGKTKITLLNY